MEFDAGTVLPGPSEPRIIWFEDSYGVKLPLALRQLFATGNGGVPKSRTFNQAGRGRLIERFLPLLDDPKAVGDLGWYDITVVISQIGDRLVESEHMVGTDVVPFAALFGGDFVCLSYKSLEVEEPTVVVWDHEQSEEGAPHLEQVASDLIEFLSQLK
jgi:hypothetical protein